MGKIRLGKRLLALAMAGALTLPAAAAYTDTDGHWAQPAIDRWSGEYGVLQGYDDGSFRPDATITRGAFAGIMARFLRYREEADANTFSDSAGDFWESAILKLNAAGVYLGTDGQARIYSEITRQQAVTMIARAFGIPDSEEELAYADAGETAEYARGSVAAMAARGYLTDVGEDNCFRPAASITRAEVVNILSNMITLLVQEPGRYSEIVNGTLMITAEEGATLYDTNIYGDLIIAPGVTGTVNLQDVTVRGAVRNMGGAEIVRNQTHISYEGQQTEILPDVTANPLTANDFAWDERGRLHCTSEAFETRFGIDVSAYQNRNDPAGNINWEAVAADGVEFAMVRIALRGTSSGTLYPDAFYAQNIDGAMEAGIDTGVYIFSSAISVEEAVEEADYVISLLEGHAISGPVAFDWEMKDSTYRVYGTEPAVATACALAFCQRIQEAGYQPMVYVSRYVGYFKFDLSQLQAYPIWYPEYKYPNTDPARVYPVYYYLMDYWQYSDKTAIAGIVGNVDTNLQLIPV